MKELKFLNKFLYKYRIKLIIGFFITVTARIFALVAPNLVGNSITLIENYVLSSSIELEALKSKLFLNILLNPHETYVFVPKMGNFCPNFHTFNSNDPFCYET